MKLCIRPFCQDPKQHQQLFMYHTSDVSSVPQSGSTIYLQRSNSLQPLHGSRALRKGRMKCLRKQNFKQVLVWKLHKSQAQIWRKFWAGCVCSSSSRKVSGLTPTAVHNEQPTQIEGVTATSLTSWPINFGLKCAVNQSITTAYHRYICIAFIWQSQMVLMQQCCQCTDNGIITLPLRMVVEQ
jgi:hypothetical protein